MSNLEWLLQNNLDYILNLLVTSESLAIDKTTNNVMECDPSDSSICNKCRFVTSGKASCDCDDIVKWLKEKHEELACPIGSPIEVRLETENKDLFATSFFYYAGIYNGQHYMSLCIVRDTRELKQYFCEKKDDLIPLNPKDIVNIYERKS